MYSSPSTQRTGHGSALVLPVQRGSAPARRRSNASALVHRVVAARASAVVLEREGFLDEAARLRREADLWESGGA